MLSVFDGGDEDNVAGGKMPGRMPWREIIVINLVPSQMSASVMPKASIVDTTGFELNILINS